jgi:hypothetical protein
MRTADFSALKDVDYDAGRFRRTLPYLERTFCTLIYIGINKRSRSQWPRGLRRGPAVARLLGLRVRIPPGSWMSVSCGCCVLSGRGLCVGLITRPEESYRVCVCVCVCVCV